MVRAWARGERCFLKEGALGLRRKKNVLLTRSTAKEAFAAVTTDLGFVCILAAYDAIVLPSRSLDAPNVKLVNCLDLLYGGVGNVDSERHGEERQSL